MGEVFALMTTCEKNYTHGEIPLMRWYHLTSEVISRIGGDAHLSQAKQFAFLDTETTGLGGGAMAFQVGVGYFSDDGCFEVRQYFLRNPGEEAAMLHHLAELLAQFDALVTFNGRTFDIPLLNGRFIMNRIPASLEGVPNLDLLGPARRMWRRRLSSVALSALEKAVLGLQRSEQDVSGALIPWLYQNYLQSGDASAMFRVLYHNRLDLLSMVTLTTVLHDAFIASPDDALPPDDRLSLAKWHEKMGRLAEAERAYRIAVEQAEDDDTLYDALHGLGLLLKRADRRDEACPLWRTMAGLRRDVTAHEELAKYHEWHTYDLQAALAWCDEALTLIDSWYRGKRHKKALEHFIHRRARIKNKLMED
jgi:hypothetical protein